MSADERWIGRQIQCPNCQKSFTVPGATNVPPLINPVTAPQPQAPTATPSATAKTSGLAIASFVLALATLPLNVLSRFIHHLPIGFLGCIPAVICGHIALSQIRRGNLRGRGLAIAGMVIGYIMILVAIIAVAFLFVRSTVQHRTSTRSSRAQTEIVPSSPPVATDPNTAEIPATLLSGTVEGQHFTITEADMGAGSVLHLRQKTPSQTEILIFLFLKPSDDLSGLKRIVAGTGDAPHIHVRWKDGAKSKTVMLTGGYAMRLEFGNQSGNKISGQLYLELPETYHTKVAGTFDAKVR